MMESEISALPLWEKSVDVNDVDVTTIAQGWARDFNAALRSSDVLSSVSPLLTSNVDPWLKDHLALTWDIRTLHGLSRIADLLKWASVTSGVGGFSLLSASLVSWIDRLPFIQASFSFETNLAKCSAIVKLVPNSDGQWKAWTIFTKMDDLKGYEEDLSRLDVADETGGDTADVLVIGGGQCGLQVSAALRALGLKCITAEQRDRVGDQWRQHYDALTLHLSKWYCQFAYRPYPPDMPFYPTRRDIADFLEHYARSTHLNLMTSTSIKHALYKEDTQRWHVTLAGPDSRSKTIIAGQIVMATGINGLKPILPEVRGKETYIGTIMHSSEFKSGSAWRGKRAIVVGAGNSGHDVAQDLYDHGASVTMIQRNPTMVAHPFTPGPMLATAPPDTPPDVIMESTPNLVTRMLAKLPRAMSDSAKLTNQGLIKAGFRLKDIDRINFLYERFGGHYMNTGTSDLIVTSKIDIKSGVPIESFTSNGLGFADGTELPADLVVFATGYDLQSMLDTARSILGEEEGKCLKEVWGLDEEGDVKGAYRDSGHPRFWYFGGDFQGARYFSKIVALEVKATQLGILARAKV